MDPRERNAQAHEKQQEKVATLSKQEQMDQEIDGMSAQEIAENLSKRNADYVFQLRKALSDEGFDDQKIDTEMAVLLPDILKAQRRGTPANKLYGGPTVKAYAITHKPKPVVPTPFWQKASDSALMFFGILTLMNGVMAFFTKSTTKNQGATGIVSMLVISIVFGLAFTKMNDLMRLPKSQRPKMGRMILYMVGLLAVALVILSITIFIPKVLNPVLPGTVLLVIGVLAFGGRYLFRRYFHIKESFFAPAPPTDDK
ncbi:DUF1129 domain-containing protein [Schleiferilactobacillus shenzhenensis]|uniref:DUF1129 domain-containing protein n=1 Tax=Schleiferilactobacillus shenzhenensis TaxID=1231337 RepID=UPI0004004C22|nr:DUF1129 domain-containing protein [Schleiferilactobacillus shenzhenensis]